jgi:hypothetical protein
LYSVWNSDSINKYRQAHLSGKYEGICKNCTSYQAYPNIFFKSQCQSA